jgi:hypothetical protein
MSLAVDFPALAGQLSSVTNQLPPFHNPRALNAGIAVLLKGNFKGEGVRER